MRPRDLYVLVDNVNLCNDTNRPVARRPGGAVNNDGFGFPHQVTNFHFKTHIARHEMNKITAIVAIVSPSSIICIDVIPVSDIDQL